MRLMLKKVGLDETIPSNYRPVANLPFVSKLMERVVLRQLINYLQSNSLLPEIQSAYRRGHSAETAVLRVHSDLVDAIEKVILLCLRSSTYPPHSTRSTTTSYYNGYQ